jgi:hypothetical protein
VPKRARADAAAHPLGGPASTSGSEGLACGTDHGVGLSTLRSDRFTRIGSPLDVSPRDLL